MIITAAIGAIAARVLSAPTSLCRSLSWRSSASLLPW